MKVFKITTAATVALFLGLASAAAQSTPEQPEGLTPSKPLIEQVTPGVESPAGENLSIQGGASAPTLDEAKCVQAKNDNRADDVKAFCPPNEWLPNQ